MVGKFYPGFCYHTFLLTLAYAFYIVDFFELLQLVFLG